MSGTNGSQHRSQQASYQPTRTANDVSEHFRQARLDHALTPAVRDAWQAERDFLQDEDDVDQAEPETAHTEQGVLSGRDLETIGNRINEHYAQTSDIPAWQRELAASQTGGRSYASSIISTRTRLTVASDDARSVEIQAGGVSYRISRDGSQITDVSPPPPYSGLHDVLEEEEALANDDVQSEASVETVGARRRGGSASVRSQSLEIPREHVPTATHQPIRSEAQSGLWFQERLRSAIGLTSSETSPRSANANGPPVKPSHNLRRTQSASFGYKWLRPWSRGSEAEPSSNSNDVRNGLRSSLGRSAMANNASNSGVESEPESRARRRGSDSSSSSSSSSTSSSSSSQSVTSEDHRMAAISEHYHELLRNIDREHRQKLHDRDVELSKLRELLNDKDIVYRQQLRERDDTIDAQKAQLLTKDVMINDLKTKFYELGEEVEQKLEKARNAVEDVWEKRWKEREQLLLREKVGKSTKHSSPRDVANTDSGTSAASAPATT